MTKNAIMKRKNIIHRLLMAAMTMLVMACNSNEARAQLSNDGTMTQKMYMTIDGRTEAVTLADNSAVQALVENCRRLLSPLPTSNEHITAQPGDVVLYSGSNICIFYGTNSWSYTRLGHIDGLSGSELRTFLKAGESDISVTLSLDNSTGINQVRAFENTSRCYTLQGSLAQEGIKGIVIKNGKKIVR